MIQTNEKMLTDEIKKLIPVLGRENAAALGRAYLLGDEEVLGTLEEAPGGELLSRGLRHPSGSGRPRLTRTKRGGERDGQAHTTEDSSPHPHLLQS